MLSAQQDNRVFSKDYGKNAHCQTNFNEKSILEIASLISKHFSKQAINILDLCCGNGKPTNDLLGELDRKKIRVNKIVGYDISSEQIEIANSQYRDKRLQFRVQDIEKMEDRNSYHVIISLFGLHWMNDIKKAVHKIYQASKPSAQIFFFIPLEKMDLFNIRKQYLDQPKWRSFFKDFNHKPFIEDGKKYIKAFKPYFSLSDETFSGTREMIYSEQELKNFLLSWLPEIRHLKTQIKDQEQHTEYVKGLTECIPVIETIGMGSDVYVSRFREENHYKVRFRERFLSFTGCKKALELPPNSFLSESLTVQNTERVKEKETNNF